MNTLEAAFVAALCLFSPPTEHDGRVASVERVESGTWAVTYEADSDQSIKVVQRIKSKKRPHKVNDEVVFPGENAIKILIS